MNGVLPEPGQIVIARQRPFVVTRIETSTLPLPTGLDSAEQRQHLVELSSVDDEGLGEELSIVWELEPGVSCFHRAQLPALRQFDAPRVFDAFLDAVAWGSVSSADNKELQAPFRSGVDVDDYQLDPVVRALLMPRVNLLIADDVGLGKTIEAGLVNATTLAFSSWSCLSNAQLGSGLRSRKLRTVPSWPEAGWQLGCRKTAIWPCKFLTTACNLAISRFESLITARRALFSDCKLLAWARTAASWESIWNCDSSGGTAVPSSSPSAPLGSSPLSGEVSIASSVDCRACLASSSATSRSWHSARIRSSSASLWRGALIAYCHIYSQRCSYRSPQS